mgnify:CR=1 FL=1
MQDSNALRTSLVDVSEPFALPPVRALLDDELIAEQRALAEIRRRVDSAAAAVAAEIAHRSRHDLGHAGLAQRLGTRTPERLIQRLTGATARDAAAMVRVGALLPDPPMDAALARPDGSSSPADAASEVGPDTGLDAPAREPEAPWLLAVGAAVAAAELTLDAAEAIRAGLGVPDESGAGGGGGVLGPGEGGGVHGGADDGASDTNPCGAESVGESSAAEGVSVAKLAAAARQLVAEAPALTVEQLAARARALRADLDADADATRIAGIEQAQRDRRYLYLSRQPDGMTRISGLLDPESAAVVTAAIDAATSPRRGGPRFVDATDIARADELVRDRRTTPQIAADALVELVRLGGAVAPTALLGARTPAVQVLVTQRDLAEGRGLARIEGQSEPVSIPTAQRHVCEGGVLPVVVDDSGNVLDLGREMRLYSRRQRQALAVRDGGCRFPGCDRPPSWTEAHHIVPWSAGGRTDLADGVLLCRHHHLLLHNNGWRVTRTGADYFVVPPRTLDPEQRPISAPTKSRILERVVAARAG